MAKERGVLHRNGSKQAFASGGGQKQICRLHCCTPAIGGKIPPTASRVPWGPRVHQDFPPAKLDFDVDDRGYSRSIVARPR